MAKSTRTRKPADPNRAKRARKEPTDLQAFTRLVKQIQKLERGETNKKRVETLTARIEKAEARLELMKTRLAALDASPDNIAELRNKAKEISKKLGL